MIQAWRIITEFPRYSVSTQGLIRNDETGRILRMSLNQGGISYVTLYKNGIQYKRSVAVIVAETYIRIRPGEAFDTPIHLNGDKADCSVPNLMWRPRWWAVRYHKQFNPHLNHPQIPVEEMDTGERFMAPIHAAAKFGLLANEIIVASLGHTPLWPTWQRFRRLH